MKNRKRILLELPLPELRKLFSDEYKIIQNQNPNPDFVEWFDNQRALCVKDGKVGIELLSVLLDSKEPSEQDRKRAHLIMEQYIKKLNLFNRMYRGVLKSRRAILKFNKLELKKQLRATVAK